MSKIAKTTTTQESKLAQVAGKKPVAKSAKTKTAAKVSTKKTAAQSTPSVKIVQPSTVWPFELDHVEDWAYFKGAFTAEECGKIIEIGNARIVDDSRIRGNEVANDIRDSKNSWIMPCDDSHWIFRRVTDVIVDLNSKFFKFDLYGFIEGFQFTRYDAPGGKYDQHIDRGLNTWTRKLSFTLQLSDPKDYVGGDLELYYGKEPTIPTKEQGFVAVFPSYVLHRVTPVTKGTRYSLVAWITGPSFK
jgi:PKHD-type hydroxylase